MRKFSSALKVIVSVGILLFLLRKANLAHGISFLGEIRYSFVLLSIGLIVFGQVLRAHRLGIMVFGKSASRKIWQMMRIQMVSFLPGVISPAKIGEVTKIYMLQTESNIPMTRGLVCFVAERVLDLLLLGPLAAFGLLVFFRSGLRMDLRSGWIHLAALSVAAIAGALVIGFLWGRSRGISLADLWRTVSPRRLFEAAVMTVLYWVVVFLEVWCFCSAVLVDATVWHIALVVPPALLSSMIPITFSGFGVREAALIILFQKSPIATSYEQALLISLMYDIIGLGVPFLMGVFFWLVGKKDGTSSN